MRVASTVHFERPMMSPFESSTDPRTLTPPQPKTMKSLHKNITYNPPKWILLCLLSLAFACTARAGADPTSNHTVTNLNDSGDGSLRAAILDSLETAGADHIGFGDGASSGTIRLQSPLPTIRGTVEIVGPGADKLSVSGDSNDDGIPDVAILAVVGAEANVTISGLTLSKGLARTRGHDHDDADDGHEHDGEEDDDDDDHGSRRRGGALTVALGATLSLEKVAVVDCVARKHRRHHHSDDGEEEEEKADDDDDDDHGDDHSGFPAGAGIAVLLANLHVDSCLIANNGISTDLGTILLNVEDAEEDDDDDDNGTVGAGAAIFLVGSPSNEVTIRNSTISGNDANSHSNGNAHSGAIGCD